MTEQEFQAALNDFFKNGGKVKELPYRTGINTFASKGAVWSKSFSRAKASGYASTDALIK